MIFSNNAFFQWNKKITTPPGLYLATLGFLKPFSELYAFGEEAAEKVCPTSILRFVNVVFAVANAYLIYLINCHQHKSLLNNPFHNHYHQWLSAISLASLPCLFFFNFLFYTDPGSLFFVLLMYFHHLNNQDWLASVFGIISLLFRQTNIVWIFFVAANFSIGIIQKNWDKLRKKTTRDRSLVVVLTQVLTTCAGYLVAGLGFLFFLYWNKGVVLGDRTAHEVSFNLPQVFYFFGFCLCFGFPYMLHWESIKSFVKFVISNKLLFILMSTATGFLLRILSTAHPYLLADNRHYTFYIWRRILNPSNFFSDWTLPVILVFAGWQFFHSLSHKDVLWKILFMFCISLSLVPQKLLEFRYFIAPFVLWRLNISSPGSLQVNLEWLSNLCMNIMTVYIFLFRPFVWEYIPSQDQRFMW